MIYFMNPLFFFPANHKDQPTEAALQSLNRTWFYLVDVERGDIS